LRLRLDLQLRFSSEVEPVGCGVGGSSIPAIGKSEETSTRVTRPTRAADGLVACEDPEKLFDKRKPQREEADGSCGEDVETIDTQQRDNIFRRG
ncbi:hypothetical protein DMN91_007728, partial [Ooceraea biroi]